MEIRPGNNRVVVKREEYVEFTPGGIALPETANVRRNPPEIGKVTAVGPIIGNDFKLKPPNVMVGDRITYLGNECIDVEIDGQTVTFVDLDGLLGIIEPAPTNEAR